MYIFERRYVHIYILRTFELILKNMRKEEEVYTGTL